MTPKKNPKLKVDVEKHRALTSSLTTPIAAYPMIELSPPLVMRNEKRQTINGSMASRLRTEHTIPCLWENP
jgi:hypothetical protein